MCSTSKVFGVWHVTTHAITKYKSSTQIQTCSGNDYGGGVTHKSCTMQFRNGAVSNYKNEKATAT